MDSVVETAVKSSDDSNYEIKTNEAINKIGKETEFLNTENDSSNPDNSKEKHRTASDDSNQFANKKHEVSGFVSKDLSTETVNNTKHSNEKVPKKVDKVDSSNDRDQTSSDLKHLKNKKREGIKVNVLKHEDFPSSNTTEKDIKHIFEKDNQQSNKIPEPLTLNLKSDVKDINSPKLLSQNQETSHDIKGTVQSKQQAEDKIKPPSSAERNESNSNLVVSPILSENDIKLGSDSLTNVNQQFLEEKEKDTMSQHSIKEPETQVSHSDDTNQLSLPIINEAINDLTASKPSTSKSVKNDLKSKEHEMSSGPLLELNKSIEKTSSSGEVIKDKTPKLHKFLKKQEDGNSKSSTEGHSEKSPNKEPSTSLERRDNTVQSSSSSNESPTLSIESDESSKEKPSSDLSENSRSKDHAETRPSELPESISLSKPDKQKAKESAKSSTGEENLFPSVKSISPTPIKATTLSKHEAIASKIHYESQNSFEETNKPSSSTSPPATEAISNKSNNTSLDYIKESSLDSDNVQPKIISGDIPSTSKEMQEIPARQSESIKPEELSEQNLSSLSASSSKIDSTTKSKQKSETINNQHSKETLQGNETNTNRTNISESSISSDESRSSSSNDIEPSLEAIATKHDNIAKIETVGNNEEEEETESSDNSRQSSLEPPSPVEALRNRFEGLTNGNAGTIRPQSPYRRMSFRSTKAAIALERTRDTSVEKPWVAAKQTTEQKKVPPKRSIKQQLEIDRKVRKMVADKKVRTYRKAEIVVQLMDLNFEEDEAIQAASECSTLELAISFLQQDCLLCAGKYPVSQMISMVHCPHKACRECIRAYFTVQIRDRNIMKLLCPFCNEPDIFDEDIAQDYFNHLDIMLKKLVDFEIHELFQRKLRDRVLMRDPNFRWCSQCSSGFIAMENLTRLVCPDCNAVMCASCRRPWEKEHNGMSCEEFAALKDANDGEAQAVGLARLLTEDGIDCPMCHFRYQLAKGGCMHFRCTQCQHDFCSGCYRPFKMGQKCGVSEFCAKLGLHAHHPRNCLFYLRDKEPQDLQRLLDMSGVKYDRDPPEGIDIKRTCQVMEQKETPDGMVDDCCGKEVEEGYAGLCRIHYVEYLGQLVNKNKVDPIQIFEVDDVELVLKRANIRLPYKKYRETDDKYRERLVQLIEEELPLDKMDGS